METAVHQFFWQQYYSYLFLLSSFYCYLGKGERIILKCVLKIEWEGVDWINVAQDNVQMRVLVDIGSWLCVIS